MHGSRSIPEITLRAIILAIILTIILGAANAYLGLKVGLTVSASIPASVIALGILRFFKNSNVLESNIVQTAASSGEALTAGVAFTLPALIVIHHWTHFGYLATAAIAMVGGILGVLFSVPLRRAMLHDPALRFPEGTAIGTVLKAHDMEAGNMHNLLYGGGVGAVIAFCQGGIKVLSDSLNAWVVEGSTVFGTSIGFAPALIGAGYIIGVNTALSILLGIFLGWVVGVPIISHFHPIANLTDSTSIAMTLWDQYIRYIGLGTMVVGGVWAVIVLVKPMIQGVKASMHALHQERAGTAATERTEKDIPLNYVLWGSLIAIIPVYFIIQYAGTSHIPHISTGLHYSVNGVGVLFVLLGGFIFASICAYFAGLVGSSTSPISSMALIALIVVSYALVFLMSQYISLTAQNAESAAIAGTAIIITALIAAVAAISNDTMQDLKAGYMVGATPWKQQVMLMIGVIVAALVMPVILQLLFDAYGLGGVFPRPGMDPSQMLLAPQAGLMAAVVTGIITHNAHWNMAMIGVAIGIGALIADVILKPKGYRVPILAVGIGIYLPVGTASPLVIGGILSYFVNRQIKRRSKKLADAEQGQQFANNAHQCGLMIACGLVAGAAITGVLLAIPFVISGNSDVWDIVPKQDVVYTSIASLIVTLLLCYWVYRRVIGVK